jgi:hypothetical protein
MRTLTKIKAITIVFLFLGLLTSVYFVTQSFAQEPSAEDAGFENVTYKGIDEAYPQIDITKTATGFSSSMLIEPTTFAITGQSSTVAIEEAGKCLEAVQAGGSIDDCGLGSGAYAPSNSLMGATSSLAMMSNPDVIPLNLALYFREQVKDVPIIGAKVYAQGEGRFNNLFGADLAYMLWKTFRNMAYGLVSIFLVVIGIFIMLRKKTDPKTVLTLQAALPKVIISLVLITFSFAIGATMTNFIFPLRKISDNILVTLKNDVRGETIEDGVKVKVLTAFALPAIIGGLLGATTGSGGALIGAIAGGISIGAISFMFTGIFALALLIVTILVYIKTLIIYVRMLGSVVFSPLIFAWGAIPGNDAATINWFKGMVAKLISVVGMYFLLKLSEFIPRYAIYSGFFGPNITSFSGGMIADFFKGSLQIYLIMLMTPFISMMLCIQALSVPKKVEGWILGQKR